MKNLPCYTSCPSFPDQAISQSLLMQLPFCGGTGSLWFIYSISLRKALPHRKHRCPGSDCDNTSNHTGAACFMWTHFNDMVWSCITQILAKTTCCVKCQKSAGLFGILETTGLILTAKPIFLALFRCQFQLCKQLKSHPVTSPSC